MVSIDALLKEIDERVIAKKVGIPNDEARISFDIKKNTVDDFDEFSRIIGDYYNHHFTQCVSEFIGRTQAGISFIAGIDKTTFRA